jgi:hypothetical protein
MAVFASVSVWMIDNFYREQKVLGEILEFTPNLF